ncbi:MAG: response regulator transcription factor [Aureliella sp.]
MQMKVLVAEDDAVTREGLIEVLQSEGVDTVAAADGMQAWELFQRERPDFVCMDVMMPGRSGFEVCRKIRHEDSNVPIVFITAKGEEVDKVVGLEIGADDYIVKPFGVKEVIARIRAVARRCLRDYESQASDGIPSLPFEMRGLTVFPKELRCKRGSVVIDLSLREVKILSLLYRNAGNVVDRNELMTFAWQQNYFPSSRTLDQHISQLRKRVEEDPKKPKIIQTVHGVGYRFEVCAES